jgi:hypothetical protein
VAIVLDLKKLADEYRMSLSQPFDLPAIFLCAFARVLNG